MTIVRPHKLATAGSIPPIASAYLDLLRAIAANLVVLAHLRKLHFGVRDTYSLGSLGVTVFFLLSGFLIMQSIMNRDESPGPRLPRFLADRVARIVTPYLPALVIVALLNFALINKSYGGVNSAGFFSFLGNLLLLQDHSGFQFMEMAHITLPFKIHPYNSAEPFWTVAVEMWIYVAVGLFFFCLIMREKIDSRIAFVLWALSLPVVIWNAAAGGGKCLTLIWFVGAAFGFLFHLWSKAAYSNNLAIGGILLLVGTVALIGRVGKASFYPYDFQTATLLAFIMFGAFALLVRAKHVPTNLVRTSNGLASYSYSLYLMHNTVLIVVLENLHIANSLTKAVLAVLFAHASAYLLYYFFERHYRSVGKWLRPAFEQILRSSPGSLVATGWARSAGVGVPTAQPPSVGLAMTTGQPLSVAANAVTNGQPGSS